MKIFWSLFFALFWAAPVFASPEMVQIVMFGWDQQNKKLDVLSLGSGTIIEPNLVLTNKHVISKDDGTPGDFLLLCLSGTRASQPVSCDIPASVTAVHPTFDAALVRPVQDSVYFPPIKTGIHSLQTGDRIRVEGFPVPVNGLSGFGGQRTFENVKQWIKEGGELKTSGDKLTITRGKIRGVGFFEATNEIYYLTDVKVNFGNSGGAAFDENRNFVGIPTLRDKEYNALVLDYQQIKDWVGKQKLVKPSIDPEILSFYAAKVKPTPVSSRRISQTGLQTSQISSRLRTSIRKIRSRPRPSTATSNTSSTSKNRTSLPMWGSRVIPPSLQNRIKPRRTSIRYYRPTLRRFFPSSR